ncbi:hypothetical protein K2Q08_02015 [Patescibacteria group bacterium]|nr:hypothetical protein [Patescibacteria group bacterium]
MALDWGKRMRVTLSVVVGAVVLLVLAGVLFAVLYKVPTCTDRVQNQDEEGVDCGGSCAYLCTATLQAPRVTFIRPVSPQPGRTDIIAYIDNRNPRAAAKHAGYSIELFGSDGARITTVTGTIDLPPGRTVPLFIPAAAQGSVVATAFLTFSSSTLAWYQVDPDKNAITLAEATLRDGPMPRITTTLDNPSFDPQYDVQAVAVVFDASGTAIAASRTVLPNIKARTSVPVTFTWNAPFIGTAAHVEVTALAPLP